MTLFLLKTIKLIENGLQPKSGATPLFSMRTVSLPSLQSCLSVDIDVYGPLHCYHLTCTLYRTRRHDRRRARAADWAVNPGQSDPTRGRGDAGPSSGSRCKWGRWDCVPVGSLRYCQCRINLNRQLTVVAQRLINMLYAFSMRLLYSGVTEYKWSWWSVDWELTLHPMAFTLAEYAAMTLTRTGLMKLGVTMTPW